ncbi:PWWP domain-containing DNA repair factor 3A [Trichomycterus rosablanca]|uniref:PWWP domain-containing DNA repair factor 3A n=1 Tax=Trichomycterus rosablanca TaxID=2290929 RepID=UPI002F35688F
MSSSEDHRTTEQLNSALQETCTSKRQSRRPTKPRPVRKPRGEVKKAEPKASAPSGSPEPGTQIAATNERLSPDVAQNSITCPHETPNRPRTRGRKKNPQTAPALEAGGGPAVQIPSERAKTKRTRAQGSKRSAKETSPAAPSPCPAPATPKRARRHHSPRLSSTPQSNSTQPKEPDVSPVKRKRVRSQKPEARQRKRKKKEEDEGVSKSRPIRKQRKKGVADVEPPQKPPFTSIRTRFELHEPDLQEPEVNLSSDLSIELSLQEENVSLNHSLSLEEDEEEDEEEELPSFLKQTSNKPSIREGLCVWCKLRKYPFWPAMVKSVNHKNKKASIVFIDQFLFDKKRICKGLSVSLRTLKPFDCEEYKHFVDTAKQRYGKSITWCLELISDYKIRIGCGSFEGSIIEYIADDISYPLRSEYCKASSDLVSPTQSLMEQQGGDAELQEADKQSDGFHQVHVMKKLLPDRAQAARNRANQRLVEFIVRKRGAESRLLGVVSRPETSRWWQAKQSSSRVLVGVYLEDEEQVEEVYRYLEGLCKGAATTKSGPHMDRISFILDVLLPEALTHAIAAVDRLTLQAAEGKFLRGPRHSIREQQEFDRMIEQQMKRKAAAASP